MDGASVNEDAVTETFEVVSSGPSRFGLVAAALLLCIVFGAGAVLQSGNANGDEQELVAPVVTSTSSILTATLPPHTLKPVQSKETSGDRHSHDMVVWLNTEAADSVALRAFLDDEPAVAVWWFADKEEAFEGFTEMFKDEPELVAQTAVEDLPASFWLQLVDTTSSREIEVLVTTLENQPDVAVVLEAPTGEELEVPTGEEIAKNRDLARPGVGITVWIHPDATEVETSKLLELVREGSHPGSYRFFDQQASFAEFTRMFADDDEVLAAVEPSDLPSSIRIVFPEPATALELSEHRDRYRTEPGVRDVVIGELNDDFERPQVSSAQKN